MRHALGRLLLGISVASVLSVTSCGTDSAGPGLTGGGNGTERTVETADGDASDKSSPDEKPTEEEAFGGQQEETYEEAKFVCGTKPPREIARDFGLHTSDPERIASRYARGYVRVLRQSVYEGCLAGLRRGE